MAPALVPTLTGFWGSASAPLPVLAGLLVQTHLNPSCFSTPYLLQLLQRVLIAESQAHPAWWQHLQLCHDWCQQPAPHAPTCTCLSEPELSLSVCLSPLSHLWALALGSLPVPAPGSRDTSFTFLHPLHTLSAWQDAS